MILIILLLIILLILFIPLNLETIVHNSNITVYLTILKKRFRVLKRDNLIYFGEKSVKEVKYSKVLNFLKKRITINKGDIKKINFSRILKKISLYLNLDIKVTIGFGLERKDLTALMYGISSCIFPLIATLMERFITAKNFSYEVYPNFNKIFLEYKVVSKIKTNLFKLILIIFILVKEIIRVRKVKKQN